MNNDTVHIAYGIFDYAFKAPQVKMLGAFAKPEDALACIQAKLDAAEQTLGLKLIEQCSLIVALLTMMMRVSVCL